MEAREWAPKDELRIQAKIRHLIFQLSFQTQTRARATVARGLKRSKNYGLEKG
jgi:hypothetical protein